MIRNSGKKIKVGILVVLLFAFLAAISSLAENRAATDDYAALIVFYGLLMLSSYFGMTAGLVLSLLGVLIYGGHHFYETLVRHIPIDISAKQAVWMIAFPGAALAGGYLGDNLTFVEKLFKKYLRQIESLVLTGQLGMMGNEITFQQGLREECSRARRSLAHFSLILLDLGNMSQLERLLGADAQVLAAEKLSEKICRSTRDIDRKAKLENTRFGIVVPDCDKENCRHVIERIGKALKQVEMEYRGRVLKAEVELISGVATYPEDGNTAEELMASATVDLEKSAGLPAIKTRAAPLIHPVKG